MENTIKLTLLEKISKNTQDQSQELQLLADIKDVCAKIEHAYARFEFEEDSDLVDASIFEIEALKARYRYLLKLAKEQNISNSSMLKISSYGRFD